MTIPRRVRIVGPLPPPVHGAAEVTKLLASALKARGVSVEISSTAPREGAKGLRYHASRTRRIWDAIRTCGGEDGAIYLSAAGGLGLAYDILIVAVARLKRRPLFIHHHSFAYLDRRSVLGALLFRVAGRRAVHICLCERMESLIRRRYGASETCTLSNAAFRVPAVGTSAAAAGRPLRIGHLGNLSAEKGLDLVVAVGEKLAARGMEVVLAGPAVDARAAALVADLQGRPGSRFEVLGPVYGDRKESFYRGIDVFLFPTLYANEAQPLVVFEALAHGVPVIAFGRGCIPEQVGGAGLVVEPGHDFVVPATSAIERWAGNPAMLAALKADAVRRAEAQHADGLRQLAALCARLAATDASTAVC